MLRQKPSCINWQFLLVGLLFIILQCDARAVNVSNTWTMPQEGLNVFYRFFRDRISWFEADAVCQFHHTNLVTVDNSFQFDATRDLLRELDVNDIVWIGLMRPQSSDRFMWSNSRPLVADTGYWAESLPLMDAPLCAVIDPIRDYRWHALRCGGPETASFLCEMPVPSWADACNLKDMPNLTLQYMADTASIELIRNCQEEGLLRTMCRGKQDRERALQDLICPRERLEAQRINDITNSHFKSLQIINSIPSDNNENNDIELLPMEVNYGPHYSDELQTEKNTVQRLIEQFNVDELMQADEPSNMETISSFYKLPGLIPKPVKKSAKKVLDYPKKNAGKQKVITSSVEQIQRDRVRLPLEMEEMMLGDQPLQGEAEIPEQFLNEEVSNEILEPLPHIKKTNIHKEDGLEKMEQEAMAMKKSLQKTKGMENKKLYMMTAPTAAADITTKSATTTSGPINVSTTEMPQSTRPVVPTAKIDELPPRKVDHALKTVYKSHTEFDSNAGHLTTTTAAAIISHPMHPQLPRGNVISEESQHPHTKEPIDSSHFIPPMLMVKSHYVPPASKHGHNTEHDHHAHHEHQPKPEEKPLHFENTTEQPAVSTQRPAHNQMPETTAAPRVSHEQQKTTSKTLAISASGAEIEQPVALNKPEQYQVAVITTTAATATETENSMKPITEQQVTEMEVVEELSKKLHDTETPTAMTATTLQSVDSTTAKTVDKTGMTLLTNHSEEINKNNKIQQKKRKNEKQEHKSPQITHTDAAETATQANKLVATTEKSFKYTQKPYDLETTTDSADKIKEIADTTTAEATLITQNPTHRLQQQQAEEEEHDTRIAESLTPIKSENIKELFEITTATAEKLNAHTQTKAKTLTASTASTASTAKLSQTGAQQTPTTAETETETKTETETETDTDTETKANTKLEGVKATQSLQQIEKESTNKEKLLEDQQRQQDKEETIVKTTEILQISTTAIANKENVPQEDDATAITTTTTVADTNLATTTTTTVKPITITLPQNEVKSTETSVSSTMSTIASATLTTTTGEDPTSTISSTTSAPTTTPTTTAAIPSTTQPTSTIRQSSPAQIITTVTAVTEAEVETATAASTPRAQTSAAPETTRNFLKTTTEIPFKPNRRRSLLKPETVSYMKKILG